MWFRYACVSNDLEKVNPLADHQSRLTHRHPMARAAPIAVGIMEIFKGCSPIEVANKMIEAAASFDVAEKLYKPNACKILKSKSVLSHSLLTSDMIAYAVQQAQKGVAPEKVLGTNNNMSNFRSPQGFLLGWAADEAVAAAVYVFLRHPDNLELALQEVVNTPGDSDSIATLAGALVGAYSGLYSFMQRFDYSLLENKVYLEELSKSVSKQVLFAK